MVPLTGSNASDPPYRADGGLTEGKAVQSPPENDQVSRNILPKQPDDPPARFVPPNKTPFPRAASYVTEGKIRPGGACVTEAFKPVQFPFLNTQVSLRYAPDAESAPPKSTISWSAASYTIDSPARTEGERDWLSSVQWLP